MQGNYCICSFFLFFLLFHVHFTTYGKTVSSSEFVTEKEAVQVEHADIIVRNIKEEITLLFQDQSFLERYEGKKITIYVNQIPVDAIIHEGQATFPWTFHEEGDFTIAFRNFQYKTHIHPIPLWFSVIPPLVAILFALVFKEVYSALFIGLLIGTTTLYIHQEFGFFSALVKGIFDIPETYVLHSLEQREHLSIILFSMLIGGMVSIITQNGGMKGIVNIISKYAKNARSGQLATWLMGIAIFFDDYANTLVVGNTMRPVTDRLGVSREKLAYIVDSTAAPIAAIAFVTTWIGAELSYIQNGINTLGLQQNPYNVFINSLAYSFYPIFALLFVGILAYSGKDFGPMYRIEMKKRSENSKNSHHIRHYNENNNPELGSHAKPRAFNAIIPVMIIILGTIAGLFYTGFDPEVWTNGELSLSKKLSVIIGQADAFKALLWSSILGVVVAIILTVTQKILRLKETMDSLTEGFKTMLTAIVILILAWSLALLTKHLHTADFISQILISIQLSPHLIPALTFVLAALIAFSTGTSWGTMAILYPLILPASWFLAQNAGLEHTLVLGNFHNVVSCVLAGAVLGDHCSPISDTTILSSLASSCNHIEHVRTQLPYALTVGGIAITAGTIPSGYGIPGYVTFPAGIIILLLIVHFFGKKTCCKNGASKNIHNTYPGK
jgi:Na+/H+ antiporter NhaC